jgi:hypothetical protein
MTARDDAPARPPLSAEELEDIASTARELVRVWGSFQPMSPHHNTLRLLAEHAALKADLAEAQRSLADTSTRYLALTERVITVADEATGPHPVIDADEALTLIERAFFDGRVQHAALTAALATRDAELAEAIIDRDAYHAAGAKWGEAARLYHDERGAALRNLATMTAFRDQTLADREASDGLLRDYVAALADVRARHESCKEANRTLVNNFHEIREQLAACRRELAEALRSSCEDERIEEREAELAACRRERDEALRLEPLRTRLWCNGGCEMSRATCFYALDGDVALNCDKCCGHAACTRLAAQSAPSERKAPVFVDEPDPDTGCYDCGHLLRCKRHAPQPAEATGAPSEREAPALHNVREAADVNPDGSKWPQTPERIAASIVKGWLSDGAIGSRLDELEQSIANVIQGDRDATKRVLDACGLAAPQPAEATGAEPAWWSEVDAEAQARIASGELAINAEATGAELPSNPKCGVCKRAWNADPGTVYCAAQHGTCGMCGTPRATHDCLTESVMDAKPPSAPPTAEPRSAGVTHEEALRRVRGMVVGRAESDEPRLRAYIAHHAELERRARELCEAEYALRKLGRQRYGGTPVDNGTMNDAKALRTAAIDALAELIGERS